jgi:hypothetical protein
MNFSVVRGGGGHTSYEVFCYEAQNNIKMKEEREKL